MRDPPPTEGPADLQARWTEGQAAWPGIAVSMADFAEFLGDADRLTATGPDLYLACACALGVESAHVAFTHTFHPLIQQAVHRLTADHQLIEDVAEDVISAILQDVTGPPHIARYAGRGTLRAWTAVVATRVGLEALRERGGTVDRERGGLNRTIDRGDDPELIYLRHRHREALERAFEAALATLDGRARRVLRYQIVERLGIDSIARLEQVHRATAADWLEQARAELLDRVRSHTVAAARLTESELKSMDRLIASQLDASLLGLLGTEPG